MNSLRIADIVRAEVKKLPASSCAISYDGPSRAQDDDADYVAKWEIDIQPAPASACPIEISFKNTGYLNGVRQLAAPHRPRRRLFEQVALRFGL